MKPYGSSVLPTWVGLVAVALFLGGCVTPGGRFAEPATSAAQRLSDADLRLAQALANFSYGVLRERLGDRGALSNFVAAAELMPEDVRIHFHLAMQYVARGDGAQAQAVMQELCRRNPKLPEAWLLAAHVAQVLQKPDDVLAALQQAVKAAPRQTNAHLQLAAFYADQRDEERVLATLENALKIVDEPLPIWRVLGDLYSERVKALPSGETERDKALHRAIECYETAAQFPADSLWAEYQEKLADLYMLSGRFDAALAALEGAVERSPDNPAPAKKQALCLEALGRHDEARALLQTLLKQDPEDPDLLCALGELYEKDGNTTDAARCFSAAIAAAPNERRAYLRLAGLLAPHDLKRAIRVLQDGAAQLPDDLAIQDLLARLYLRDRRGADALEIFQRLQARLETQQPQMLTTQFWLGYAAAARQSAHPEEAARLYEKILSTNPHQADAYLNLALLHLSQTNRQEAIAVMRRALDAMPEEAEAWYMAGIVFSQAGQYADACKVFKHAGELAQARTVPHPLDAEYFFYFGAACERQRDYAQAEMLLEKALQIDPDYADAANYLAYMWAEQGRNLERALWLAQHAVELHPENGAYLDTLGWVYFKLERYREAEDELFNALQILPDDPAVLEHCGDLQARNGCIELARTYWLKSLAVNPDNHALRQKLQQYGIAAEPKTNSAATP